MNEPKIFRVDWQTGYIKVYVGNFFGGTNLKTIDKFLRLAKIHGTSEQQATLLADLEEEKSKSWDTTKRERIEKCIKRIKAQTWGKTC